MQFMKVERRTPINDRDWSRQVCFNFREVCEKWASNWNVLQSGNDLHSTRYSTLSSQRFVSGSIFLHQFCCPNNVQLEDVLIFVFSTKLDGHEMTFNGHEFRLVAIHWTNLH